MNKKHIKVVIISFSILLIIFSGIIINTYKELEKKEEYNYKKTDTIMAYYVDGQKVDKIPKKGNGYIFSDESNCTNGVTITWDNFNWNADFDFSGFNMSGTTRTKCNLYFTKRTGPTVLRKVGSANFSDGLWAYKNSITKIIFQNDSKPINNVEISFDESEMQDGSVVSYLVKNENETTYTAYIQSLDKLYLSPDSSYLFSEFKSLTSIEGLEYIDTSNVTNMSYMFFETTSLDNANINNWNTSKVIDMNHMFAKAGVRILDLSKWDTSNVVNMNYMFGEAESLGSLNLSNWNTSNVENMSEMFCVLHLSSLDLSSFDTSKVTDFTAMFAATIELNDIIYGPNFVYKNNAKKDSMFSQCYANRPTDPSWS